MSYYVYVLKSASTGRSYIGHSKDINNRMTEHNCGKNKATRGKGPWKLVHYEEFVSRSDATKREKYFKTQIGRLELQSMGILK